MNNENNNIHDNNFENSINSFSHNNVSGDITAEKRKIIPALLVRSVLIAICIGLFGYAVFMVASSVAETDEVEELYEDIRPDAQKPTVDVPAKKPSAGILPATNLLEPAPMYTLQEMLNSNGEYMNYIGDLDSMDDLQRRSSYYRNYVSFAKKYPDAYAWIYVSYTQIDYPVMKGDYTDYYLYHNYKGNSSSSGSITAESNLSDNYSSNINNVIYGHCMKNGSMFRTLKTFMESANKHTLAKSMNIEIYTDEGLYIYEVLSGYRHDGSFFAQTIFSDSDDFLDFLDDAVSRNTLRVSKKYNSNSRVCTLVTCANVSSNEDERYVLHGILTSFIPASML